MELYYGSGMNDIKRCVHSRNLNLVISIETEVGQDGSEHTIKYSCTNIQHFLPAQLLQHKSKPRN